jgi:hypothetical protein
MHHDLSAMSPRWKLQAPPLNKLKSNGLACRHLAFEHSTSITINPCGKIDCQHRQARASRNLRFIELLHQLADSSSRCLALPSTKQGINNYRGLTDKSADITLIYLNEWNADTLQSRRKWCDCFHNRAKLNLSYKVLAVSLCPRNYGDYPLTGCMQQPRRHQTVSAVVTRPAQNDDTAGIIDEHCAHFVSHRPTGALH